MSDDESQDYHFDDDDDEERMLSSSGLSASQMEAEFLRDAAINKVASKNNSNRDSVPLLEVQSSGSLRSYVASLGDMSSYLQYKPDRKFLQVVWEFPEYLENLLKPFDDRIISWLQFSSNKYIGLLCNLITFAVAIEIIFALPLVLFFLGLDGLGTEFTYLAFVTAIFSQIPKRFIWRYRPWMLQRANQLRRTATSSFPSRAVCCSIVYSFAVCWAYLYYVDNIYWWWMPLLVVVMFVASSFARIFLGVHYPSDCIIGALQAVIICGVGMIFWGANLLGCTSCHERNGVAKCYSETGSEEQLIGRTILDMAYVPFFIAVVISILLAILATIKPIEFWKKCERSLGLILPGIAFQVGFLCPNGSFSNSSLAHPQIPPPWWAIFPAFGLPIASLLVAHKLKSKYPVLLFVIFYTVNLTSLIVWRLFILPVEEHQAEYATL